MARLNKVKTVKSLLAASAFALCTTFSANAADLKQDIVVEKDLITFGDLFTDLSDNHDKVIFTSPKPGASKQISATELMRSAAKNGIDWVKPDYLKRINISRAGTAFTITDLKPFLDGYVADYVASDDVSVKLYGSSGAMYFPTNREMEEIQVDRFTMKDGNKRFVAIFMIPKGDSSYRRLTVTGSVVAMHNVPMVNSDIAPGDIITKEDIVWKQIPLNKVRRNTVQNIEDLIGKTVSRPIRPGRIITLNSLTNPKAIKKGETVTVEFHSGRLHLTMTGTALDHGGVGDIIRIKNRSSNRSFDAIVTGPNKVVVKPRSITTLASR